VGAAFLVAAFIFNRLVILHGHRDDSSAVSSKTTTESRSCGPRRYNQLRSHFHLAIFHLPSNRAINTRLKFTAVCGARSDAGGAASSSTYACWAVEMDKLDDVNVQSNLVLSHMLSPFTIIINLVAFVVRRAGH
jgi:hypothetical protein